MSAKEIYPYAQQDGWFDSPWDYDPIIQSFGEVLISVRDDDYQGDTRVLLKEDGQYGFLVVGWGSCSGCDALQAAESYEEIDSLIETLRNAIRWFSSIEEAKKYINATTERELEFYSHADEWKTFVTRVNEI